MISASLSPMRTKRDDSRERGRISVALGRGLNGCPTEIDGLSIQVVEGLEPLGNTPMP